MDLGLRDRVAVVTGGTSGIGRATARTLLEEGASVALCGRNVERLESVRRSFADAFGETRVLAQACDVTRPGDVASFATAVGEWRGCWTCS